MPNFNDLANTAVGDIERPPLMPVGHYIWSVTKVPAQDSIADGAYETVDFTCKCVAAGEDVDEDAITEYGDVTRVTKRLRFMFSTEDKASFDKSVYQLRRFLIDHLQIDGAEKMTVPEALNASINYQFLGEIVWRPDRNDSEVFYDEIRRTAPVA